MLEIEIPAERSVQVVPTMVSGVRIVHDDPDLVVGGHPGGPVSYTHLRAHETVLDVVCRLLLGKKQFEHNMRIPLPHTNIMLENSIYNIEYHHIPSGSDDHTGREHTL